MSNGWIGVDLDGTLAHYDGWVHEMHIGPPVPKMVEKVHAWLKEGRIIKIFTARVCPTPSHNKDGTQRDIEAVTICIQDWCEQHIGVRFEVTCVKDFGMIELWDDRCVQVVANTGEALSGRIK